jgi:hypothetical protein
VIPTDRETPGNSESDMTKAQVRRHNSVSRLAGNTGKRPAERVFPARRYVVAGTRAGNTIWPAGPDQSDPYQQVPVIL